LLLAVSFKREAILGKKAAINPTAKRQQHFNF
jgi:hypothetical protein